MPLLQGAWFAECFGEPAPTEARAPCRECPIDPDDLEPTAALLPAFSAEAKCCAYLPVLANFLVGGVLSDDHTLAAGRRSVEARIARGDGVSPLGLGRSAASQLRYAQWRFAGREQPACPHYLTDGRCGVWRHREAACATWFCRYERGVVGQRFWREGVLRLFATIEAELARWAARRLGCDGESWGAWGERREQLYVRCFELVRALRWTDVLAIGGDRLHALVDVTRDLLRDRAHPTPLVELRLGAHTAAPIANATRLVAYSPLDPLDVPTAWLAALPHFDGRPLDVVLAEIERQHGVAFTLPDIRRLVDLGVLTAGQIEA